MVHQKTIKLDSARGKPNLFEGITSENSITRLHHHQKIWRFAFRFRRFDSDDLRCQFFRRKLNEEMALFEVCIVLLFYHLLVDWSTTGGETADFSTWKWWKKWSPEQTALKSMEGYIYIYTFIYIYIPSRELTYPPKMAFWRWLSFSQGGRC